MHQEIEQAFAISQMDSKYSYPLSKAKLIEIYMVPFLVIYVVP